MKRLVVVCAVLIGLGCLTGCTLSLDLHPEGKKTSAVY